MAESPRYHSDQYIAFRPELFELCASIKSVLNDKKHKDGTNKREEPNPVCMAMFISILETITNNRREERYIQNKNRESKGLKPIKVPKEYAIKLAYSAIASLLYNAYGEATIRKSITALIHANYIKRHDTNGNTPAYILNIPILQAALDRQAGNQTQNEQEIEISTDELIEFEDIFPEDKNLDTSKPTPPVQEPTPSKRQEEIILSPDEQNFYDLWCQIWFNKEHSPKITATLKKHSATLCKSIHDFDQLKNLETYARKEQRLQGKAIQLGNLVNVLNGWIQTQQSPPCDSSSSQQSSDSVLVSPEIQEGNLRRQVERIAEQCMKEGTPLPDYLPPKYRQWAQEWMQAHKVEAMS